MLRWRASILKVYASAYDDFTVKNIFWSDDRGHVKQRMITTLQFRAIRSLNELATSSVSNTTLGSDLLRLASMDDAVARAFDLIGNRKTIGWYEMYDLIEIVGNINGIVKPGWATRAKLNSTCQTANHDRHLGSTANKNKLPHTPPQLHDARATITHIFRLWLSERLTKAAYYLPRV